MTIFNQNYNEKYELYDLLRNYVAQMFEVINFKNKQEYLYRDFDAL